MSKRAAKLSIGHSGDRSAPLSASRQGYPVKKVQISNFKSIKQLSFELGYLNVFVGENGCGKSNILEAMALASCASQRNLDTETLSSRGIRVTEPQYMRAAFNEASTRQPIELAIETWDESHNYRCTLQNANEPYSPWTIERDTSVDEVVHRLHEEFVKSLSKSKRTKQLEAHKLEISKLQSFLSSPRTGAKFSVKSSLLQSLLEEFLHRKILQDFTIYSPNYESLRQFSADPTSQPVGRNGAGLFQMLEIMASDNDSALGDICDALQVLGWFKNLRVSRSNQKMPSAKLAISDRYIDSALNEFDERSTNEGFLYLLFYYSLVCSRYSPSVFAIENIDVALNPKLCERFVNHLSKLAIRYGKQILVTTHSPSVLDGLNLDDDGQRLFVVSRLKTGETRLRRYKKPEPAGTDRPPVRLSEAFLRGYLGGLPNSF